MKITIELLENALAKVGVEFEGKFSETIIQAQLLQPAIEMVTAAILVSNIAKDVEAETLIQKEIDELTK
jgi:hypothetical protein